MPKRSLQPLQRREEQLLHISQSYLLSGCPIDAMIRYCEDRLEGLRQIKRYLEEL